MSQENVEIVRGVIDASTRDRELGPEFGTLFDAAIDCRGPESARTASVTGIERCLRVLRGGNRWTRIVEVQGQFDDVGERSW